ncbi:P-loop containing nucleoside triphosphate hydrolase protein [Aspergillus japonicus CBS 114.51]|uniref:P-loop containing nucleoside triphosphate hydrolase protein n=1 Tax=Aspergillus japonicus CBS 114.51 TaxID=1448312 RepID=A0A8T8WWF0_ASPJA|nr:P-loop containing nucleoside triphosphate hydrolase protein [Aspergillus japonicus CBS 114.51]RAH80143.1 P-loop containing nucleoside triphosphate hydrolase protein [Aspergillus japonicus CBS 114.51]
MTVFPCPSGSDNSFGPVVSGYCRAFDFTLLFEDVVLVFIPSFVFLTIHIIRIACLLPKPVKGANQRRTISLMALHVVLLGTQLALLGIRQNTPTLQTRVWLHAQILQAFDTCVAIVVTYLERAHSPRPPIWPSLHLFVAVLLDSVRARTFWLASNTILAPIILSGTLGLRVWLLILESTLPTHPQSPQHPDSTKEESSSLWELCLLTWVLPILKQGFFSPLTLEQVPPIGHSLTAERLIRRLQRRWDQVYQSRRNQLFLTVFRTFKTEFLHGVIPRLCFSAFTLMQPLLVNAMIKFVGSPDNQMTRNKGYGLIGASAIVYLGLAASKALYNRQAYRFVIGVRGALLATVYSQTLEHGAADQGCTSALTLLGTDVERIATGLRDVHEIWASPIDIGLAVWLLGRQLAVSCIVPVVLSLLCILVIAKVCKLKNQAQREWIERVEGRIDVTRRMLNDIKSIKLLGLGGHIETIISRCRSIEIATSHKFRSLLCWEVFIANFSWLVSPAASFALFTIVSTANKSSPLDPAQAFTALSLMSLITLPVLTLIQALPALFQCLGSFARLQEYFAHQHAQPLQLDSKLVSSSSSLLGRLGSEVPSADTEKGPLIALRNATVKWNASGPEVLHEIDLDVHKGDIVAIVGPVSAGKTTLLESVLGETVVDYGYIHTPRVPTAYCSQVPWLVEGSVRDNIVGPMGMQPAWYHQVLWMCGVSEDLQALPDGDLTRVGGQGNALSGGQKQRVALARAVYSRSELVVLDDIFSGLDAVTIDRICQRLLSADRGYFRCKGITVLLSTHNSKVAALVDEVFVLENGRVAQHILSSTSTQSPEAQALSTDADEDAAKKWPIASERCVNPEEDELSSDENSCAHDSTQPSHTEVGAGYSYYLKSTGRTLASLYVILILIAAFCQDFPNLWLKWWSNADSQGSSQLSGMYLGVFIAFAVGTVVVGAAGSWVYLIRMISISAERLHADLLSSIMSAPLSWLNDTTSGDILNRFSQDLELVDMTLPLAAVNATKAIGSCLLKLAILFVVAKYMSLAVPPLLLVCFLLQKCYLRTSRQIRLLSIEAKAPLFQHLSEALSGGASIRALQWRTHLEEANLSMVDNSQKCTYTLFMVQQWLTLAMDLIASGLIVLLTVLTVLMRDSFDPGSSGTAVVTLMSFTQSLARLLKFWSMTESCLGAVSRIQSFAAHTPSESSGKAALPQHTAWPSRGAIEMQNMSAAYKSNPVLNGVSMRIEPGQKIALCGRSGSGKSSLLLCLTGLLRPHCATGTIHIDGLDITSVPSQDICARLSVVPQEPCYLPGTIRFNIDPTHTLSDTALARILDTTHLTDLVARLGGVDATLDPTRWSAGQGQLLALARAVARQSKVLILDEAMSRVDHATQALMDRVVSEEFADCTVVSIVHRYDNLAWFDKVAVMENGRLVEFERPDALLAREQSRFRALYVSSGCL